MEVRRRVVEVLTALVIIGSALCLYLALTRPDRVPLAELPGEGAAYRVADLAGPGGPALAAAVDALPAALSYNFRDLDASLAAATRRMTASYADEFTATFDERARPVATARKAITEAVVRGAGLVRASDARALALVFIDQLLVRSTRQDADDPPSTLSRNRVLVTLVLRSGTWRIDDLRPL